MNQLQILNDAAPTSVGRLIRVFPRKTKASPDDELAYFGPPNLFAEGDRVHVSVTFTADKPKAERLAEEWRHVAPVEVGGVAYGDEGRGFFVPEAHRLRVYVLIGYPKDTFEAAESRLRSMVQIGFTPHAMLWQPETPSAQKWRPSPDWRSFQRQWVRPVIIHAKDGI